MPSILRADESVFAEQRYHDVDPYPSASVMLKQLFSRIEEQLRSLDLMNRASELYQTFRSVDLMTMLSELYSKAVLHASRYTQDILDEQVTVAAVIPVVLLLFFYVLSSYEVKVFFATSDGNINNTKSISSSDSSPTENLQCIENRLMRLLNSRKSVPSLNLTSSSKDTLHTITESEEEDTASLVSLIEDDFVVDMEVVHQEEDALDKNNKVTPRKSNLSKLKQKLTSNRRLLKRNNSDDVSSLGSISSTRSIRSLKEKMPAMKLSMKAFGRMDKSGDLSVGSTSSTKKKKKSPSSSFRKIKFDNMD